MTFVKLKVGGERIVTTKETLTKFPESKLAKMTHEGLNWRREIDVRLDMNPVYFRAVLDWLR